MPPIHNKPLFKETRKQLRNDGTSAEALLWKYLKNAQLQGRKFRRQHGIDNYIVDFYCASEKLAIELDGAQHFTQAGNNSDYVRDINLARHNIRVLRFENKLVFEQIDWVIQEIARHFMDNKLLQTIYHPDRLERSPLLKQEGS